MLIDAWMRYLIKVECKLAGESEGRALIDKRQQNENQRDQVLVTDRIHSFHCSLL